MATDIRKPRGVSMWRSGAAAMITSNACSSDGMKGKAKPRSSIAPCANITRAVSASAASSNKRNDVARLLGIMKNHAQRMAMPRAQAADAVTHVDPVYAACALKRAVMHCEHHSVTLPQCHNL